MAYPKITKTRYKEFADYINEAQESPPTADEILCKFCDIFKFDPDMKTKTIEQLQKDKEYLQRKKAETGLSTYILLNQSKYYQKNKERLNARRVENSKLAKQKTT
jgi:hypothetical protein